MAKYRYVKRRLIDNKRITGNISVFLLTVVFLSFLPILVIAIYMNEFNLILILINFSCVGISYTFSTIASLKNGNALSLLSLLFTGLLGDLMIIMLMLGF